MTVLDEPFAIQSEAEPDYTRRVAAHVDATLRTLRRTTPALEAFPTAVLGAMEITNDLFRARDSIAALAQEAIVRVDSLAGAIDETLDTEALLTEEDAR